MNKYKLINSKTGEEYLCDKVTIDGFDYYVSDEKTLFSDGKTFVTKENIIHTVYGYNYGDKVVIATTNPNIDDIPKVVDEVTEMAYNWLYDEETENKASQGYPLKPMEYGFIKGYTKSQETYPNSDEDMVEFYEWCDSSEEAAIFWRRNRVNLDMNGSHNKIIREKRKELLQLWKAQKPKTLYYE